MPLNSSSYIPDEELVRRIESGEAEEWEIPFICDECWVFQQGGNMSNKSNEKRLICIDCSLSEQELRDESVSDKVSVIVREAKSIYE